MALEAQGKTRVPQLKDGEPVLFQPREEKSFLKQIGSNTNYIFHPDEILADNFVHLIFRRKELKTPSIVKSMKGLLSPQKTRE